MATKEETLAKVREQLEALSAWSRKIRSKPCQSMLDARGLLDDLVRAMLEVGLAKDDERQEATLMVRHATEGP
jgi:hypothetical protein